MLFVMNGAVYANRMCNPKVLPPGFTIISRVGGHSLGYSPKKNHPKAWEKTKAKVLMQSEVQELRDQASSIRSTMMDHHPS